ncbi:MAG TPA: prepilin-type N-terminal cleavage/methylation domain-containing protein [Usitatibacter sp.]|nr:prepilin-type N-terminal cleavage/methylation domain-containing protein [Usitatibacter sp.]
MRRRRQSGFTLIELVVALVLLGAMMSLLYSGLTFALRSWDAGDANGRRAADRRLGENFLRRELSETFPMRWKDATALRYAFDGQDQVLRFVSTRAAGVAQGGLALVQVDVEADPKDPKAKNLVMRRAVAAGDVADFSSLDRVDPTLLVENVDAVAFSYFGSENDFVEPKWSDQWQIQSRMPAMIRVRLHDANGTDFPEMLVKLELGEEAGCMESPVQRGCRPRRPT